MYEPDDMGRDEGEERGPEPGRGADMYQLSGEKDFDGLSGDVLPPKKSEMKPEKLAGKVDQPVPPKSNYAAD